MPSSPRMTPQGDLKKSNVAVVTIVCTAIFTFLAIISVMIQGYNKIHRHMSFGLEDGLVAAAFLISLALVGQIMWAVSDEDQGQHLQDVAPNDIDIIAKVYSFNSCHSNAKMCQSLLVGEILWSLVATLIRIATLLMLRRIFSPLWSQTFGFVLFGLVLLHGIAAILAALCICQPIRASWDHSIGHCGNQTEAYVIFEVMGLILDLIPMPLPLYVVSRLGIRRSRKFLASFVFSIGSLVLIITGLRIAALNKVDTSDFTYNQAYLGLLSTLGALISVMLGCAFSLPALLGECMSSRKERRILHAQRATAPAIERKGDQEYQETENEKDNVEESEINV
ncbi:hypothetical protein PG995_005993 [Apiospora arundinis]